ncbi:hypothetical protein BC332_02955 [Capsicum chinense]|nr:hypothetical protein BC332_02955 [Capsicum chinense]
MFNNIGEFPQCLNMADLGCSSGPNTLFIVSNVMKVVQMLCHEKSCKMPDFQAYINDLRSLIMTSTPLSNRLHRSIKISKKQKMEQTVPYQEFLDRVKKSYFLARACTWFTHLAVFIGAPSQERLLTKERMQRLNIQVDDAKCCLCEADQIENQLHSFAECKWTNQVKTELESWSGISTQRKRVPQWLTWIKGRHWKQFKKELATAICGATIYHTWIARNWKLFRQITITVESAIIQIKKEIVERMKILQKIRKASRCGYLTQKLCI